MSENILLLSENKSVFLDFLSKINVFHRTNSLSSVSINEIKKVAFQKYDLVLVTADDYDGSELARIIELIKRASFYTQIVLCVSNVSVVDVLKCYDLGVFDFIDMNAQKSINEVKLLNCLKYISLMLKTAIISNFLSITNCVNSISGLYTHKALKEIFDYLMSYEKFKNASYIVLSLDDSVKTKSRMNILANNIKNNLRQTDVPAQGSGKFYILLPDTDLSGAKTVVEKISNIMGSDYPIHSGIASVSSQKFSEVEKNSNDSLKSAIINNKLYVSFEENNSSTVLGMQSESEKHFKLFHKSFNDKLTNIIIPLFFRYEQQFAAKLPNADICQYANESECIFSIKNNDKHSELIIIYDGFAKLNIKIMHKGLETSDNAAFNVSLNKIDAEYITKILNKLYEEFLG